MCILMYINEKQGYNNGKTVWLLTFERVHIPGSYLMGG
jgi:hypothetical protein